MSDPFEALPTAAVLGEGDYRYGPTDQLFVVRGGKWTRTDMIRPVMLMARSTKPTLTSVRA